MSNSDNAKRLFFEALALMDSSKFEEAERRLREALEFAPSNATLLTNLAVVLLQLGKRADALKVAEQAIALNAGNIEALLVAAHCHVLDKDDASALAVYDKIIARDPAISEVHNNRGIALQNLGRHAEALESYDRALALQPDYRGAHVNRGNALRQLKRGEEAVAAYDRALALDPNLPQAWLNRGNALYDFGLHADALAAYDRALAIDATLAHAWLGRGNVLSNLKRHDEAVAAFQKALSHDPNSAEAWLGLGNVMQSLRRQDEALDAFAKALAAKPDLAGAWLGRGNVLYDRRRYDDALVAYDKSLALNGDFANAWIGRGDALRQLKRSQDAIDAYRRALDLGGDADAIKYYLASLGAARSPDATPGRFVANLFDSAAETFDQDLVTHLRYQTPALLAEIIKRHASPNAWDILDLGCGTGLMGEQVRSFKRTLTGVDLSSNMLDKARGRGIYDQLVCADLVEFLQAHERAFDLAVAADVFVYVGDLSLVFGAVRRALRDDGLFCFSVEAVNEGDFVLRSTLRYAHSIGYLRDLAERNRFAVTMIEPRVVRMEAGANVDGYVALMRCA